jgi:hypothetical protein
MVAVIRVAVIAVETTERKVGIDFVFSLHLVGVVANGGDDVVDIDFGYLR